MTYSVSLIEKTNKAPNGEIVDNPIGGDIVTSREFKTKRAAKKYAIEESKSDEWYETMLEALDDWDMIYQEIYRGGKKVHEYHN